MKKKVFITGISGFAGSHLAELLVKRSDCEIFGTVFGSNNLLDNLPGKNLFQQNLLDREKTIALIKEIKPVWVFHLAALSSPAQSFKDPRGTITNNVEAQINVLDGLVGQTQVEKVLVVGSAEEYGSVEEKHLPINETQDLKPLSPYAVSKVAQDYLGMQYYLHHKLPVIRVRPFNHTGERQASIFVVPAFAEQIAKIEAKQKEPVVKVGNLDAIRDFSDVKDMVRAYVLAMEKAIPGEVYNLGCGRGFQIRQVLNELISLSKVEIKIETDALRRQPSDIPWLVADAAKFRAETGWETEIPFNQTLTRVLDYWRRQVTS